MKLRVSAVLASGILALLLALACSSNQGVAPTAAPSPSNQVGVAPTATPAPANQAGEPAGSLDEYQTYKDQSSALQEESQRLRIQRDELNKKAEEYREKIKDVDSEAKKIVNEDQNVVGEKVDEAMEKAIAAANQREEAERLRWQKQKDNKQFLEDRLKEAQQEREELGLQLQDVEALEAENLRRSETLETTADQQARADAKLITNSDFRQLQNAETRFDQTEAQSLAGPMQKLKDLQSTISSLESRWAVANERRGEAIKSLGILQDRLAQEQSCSPALHKHLSAVAEAPIAQAQYPQPGDVPITGYMMADSISGGLKKCGGN